MQPLHCSLYVDVVSPWSFIAYELILRYETLWRLEIDVKPVVLGGIFGKTGNRAPISNAAKSKFMGIDLKRSSAFYGVAVRGVPSNIEGISQAPGPKFTSVAAQRLLVQVREVYGTKDARFRALVRALFKRFVNEGAGRAVLVTTDSLEGACVSAGFTTAEARELLQASNASEVKARLRQLTEEAVAHGAFGLPYFVFEGPDVSDENARWFGTEKFEQMAFALHRPWLGPQPGAQSKL